MLPFALLAQLVAASPTSPPPAQPPPPEAKRAVRGQLLIGMLSFGGGLQMPLRGTTSLSLEAALGPQVGVVAFPATQYRTDYGSTLDTAGSDGFGADLGHVSLAARFGTGKLLSLDAGLRLSLPVWEQDGLLGATFVGGFLQPSLGTQRVRLATTLAVGPFLGRWSGNVVGLQWLPLTFVVLF